MIKKGIAVLLLAGMLALVSGCFASKAVRQQRDMGLVTIESLEIEDYSVVLTMDEDYSTAFTVHKPADPYLVIIELPDMGIGALPHKIQSSKLGISEVKLAMVQTPLQLVRIEILLDAPLDVEPVKVGNSLVIKILTPEQGEARTMAVEEAAAMASGEPLEPATELTEMIVQQGPKDVKLTVFSDGLMEPDIFTLTGRIIIDVPDVTMRATLPEKVYPPITGVRFGTYADKVRVVIDLEEDGDFAASTEDNTVVILIPTVETFGLPVDSMDQQEVAAPGGPDGPAGVAGAEAAAGTQEDEDEITGPAYVGKKIDLDFESADIVPIFTLIGKVSGYNTVIHPKVGGKITLKLDQVPWDQALDIILNIQGLGKDIRGNILTIAPPDVFMKQQEAAKKFQDANVLVEPLAQKAVQLKFINAAEMKKRITEAKLLSPRGTIRIDERTDTIILNDTVSNIKRIIRDEIKYWDTPEHGIMQVLIEAKVVSVRSDYTHNFGIRWGGHATEQNFSWLQDRSTVDFSVNTPYSQASPGASVPGGLLSIGYAETVTVDLSIEALETMKKAKSLANPRVLTIDKQKAKIEQGTAIPYAAQAEGGGTTINTENATLSLEVTPEIRPNGIVMLDVLVKNDSPTIIPGAAAPGIDKQQIKTKALVKDGETLVLGGIFTNTEDETEVRVPVLSKIPLIGWLFKTRSVTKFPNELLIFITPRIIKS